MKSTRWTRSRGQTLALILLPMVAAVVILRTYLHSVEIQHVYVAGHIFYHLFTGVLLIIPSAFVLAFDPRSVIIARSGRVVLGIGSGLVLDEVVFLVATDRTAEAYITPLSLGGSIALISLASILLLVLYGLNRD